jgi:hypothetical protein
MTSRDRKTPQVPQIPRVGDVRDRPVRFGSPARNIEKLDANDVGAVYDIGNPVEQAAAIKLREQYDTLLIRQPQRNTDTMFKTNLEVTSRVSEDPGPINVASEKNNEIVIRTFRAKNSRKQCRPMNRQIEPSFEMEPDNQKHVRDEQVVVSEKIRKPDEISIQVQNSTNLEVADGGVKSAQPRVNDRAPQDIANAEAGYDHPEVNVSMSRVVERVVASRPEEIPQNMAENIDFKDIHNILRSSYKQKVRAGQEVLGGVARDEVEVAAMDVKPTLRSTTSVREVVENVEVEHETQVHGVEHDVKRGAKVQQKLEVKASVERDQVEINPVAERQKSRVAKVAVNRSGKIDTDAAIEAYHNNLDRKIASEARSALKFTPLDMVREQPQADTNIAFAAHRGNVEPARSGLRFEKVGSNGKTKRVEPETNVAVMVPRGNMDGLKFEKVGTDSKTKHVEPDTNVGFAAHRGNVEPVRSGLKFDKIGTNGKTKHVEPEIKVEIKPKVEPLKFEKVAPKVQNVAQEADLEVVSQRKNFGQVKKSVAEKAQNVAQEADLEVVPQRKNFGQVKKTVVEKAQHTDHDVMIEEAATQAKVRTFQLAPKRTDRKISMAASVVLPSDIQIIREDPLAIAQQMKKDMLTQNKEKLTATPNADHEARVEIIDKPLINQKVVSEVADQQLPSDENDAVVEPTLISQEKQRQIIEQPMPEIPSNEEKSVNNFENTDFRVDRQKASRVFF